MADPLLDLPGAQRAGHVVGRGVGEDQRLQRQRRRGGRKCSRAQSNCFSPSAAAARQSSGRSCFTVGGGSVAWNATSAETSPGVTASGTPLSAKSWRSRPAHAETLRRLHAVMNVERVDGELAQRGEHALAAERPHDQIVVDAVDRFEVDDAVAMRRQITEAHALAHQVGAHVLVLGARFGDRGGAFALQVRRHLARQKFDEAAAEDRNGMALARK